MRLNDNNTFIGINPPYQLSVIHSSKLIYPREIYQRGVERKRVELIARDFNEYIVNEPKVSFRNGRYYVMDGQHTIEGCILLNGGEDRPILCKVYTGLTMEQEAPLRSRTVTPYPCRRASSCAPRWWAVMRLPRRLSQPLTGWGRPSTTTACS